MELAHSRGIVRHVLLQDASSTLNRLGAELHNVNLHLEAENLCLVCEWRRLEVAVNLSRLQCEAARSKDEESSVMVKEARNRSFEEAEAVDRRCEAVENREWELLASLTVLERQA